MGCRMDGLGAIQVKSCTLGLMDYRMDGRESIQGKKLYIRVNGLQDGMPGSHSGEKVVHKG
jgi:hypothetical protein